MPIELIIDMRHKVATYKNNDYSLVDVFRVINLTRDKNK